MDEFRNNFSGLIIWMGHMTGMGFYLTRLFKAVVCKISISHHAETMENGVTKQTFTCSKATIETLEKVVR